MRRFNFNNFTKPAEKTEVPSKPTYSAYRTVLSRHKTVEDKLKDESYAKIQE